MHVFFRFLVLSFATMGSSVAFAGVTFRTLYAAPSNHSDKANVVAIDGAGGQVMAGQAYSSTTGTDDMHLVATSSTGVIRWAFSDRKSGESEVPYALKRHAATNTYRALSIARGGGFSTLRVSSYDSLGHRLFEISIPIANSFFHKPGLALDGTGNAYAVSVRGGECLLVKIGPKGNLIWDKSINWGTGTAEGMAVTIDSNGYPVVVGSRADAPGGYTTAKVTPNGDLVWQHTYFGNHGSVLSEAWIQPTSDGDVVVCGSPETSFGVPQFAIWRLRGPDGFQMWLKTYQADPTKDAEAVDMCIDPNNNAYVCSFRVTNGTAAMLVKYSPTGTVIWERQRVGGSHRPYGVAVDAIGNCLMVGFTSSGSATGQISNYDTNGNLLWTYSKSGDIYTDAASDGKGKFQICGYGPGPSNTDMVVIGAKLH